MPSVRPLSYIRTLSCCSIRFREKELAAVKVSKEDVELIVSEFGLTNNKADRVLRENGGDVEKALVALVRN